MRLTIAILFFATLSFAQSTAKGSGAKAAAASETAPAASSQASLPSEATVNSFFQHMFGYDPNISWKILKIAESPAPPLAEAVVAMKNEKGQGTVRLFITPDGKHAILGEIMPFGADPFAANRALLEKGANGPVKGPENATVTIVEFSDLECPVCKAAQPSIDKLLADTPNARLVFENFPLEQLHPWAFKAATYANCLGKTNPAAFWKFVSDAYASQQDITKDNADDKLKQLATTAGADGAAIAACAAQPAAAEHVRQTIQLGEALQVTGTPTLFINGRVVANVTGIPYEVLKSIVDYAAKTSGQ